MEAGHTIHLKGIRAEYRLFGKASLHGCIMPDGEYIILSFEQGHVNLAWRDADGQPSKKHRYRVEDCLIRELVHARPVQTLD